MPHHSPHVITAAHKVVCASLEALHRTKTKGATHPLSFRLDTPSLGGFCREFCFVINALGSFGFCGEYLFVFNARVAGGLEHANA